MNTHLRICLFFCLAFPSLTLGQSLTYADSLLPKLVLKLSPLNLLGNYPTLQGAIEYRFSTYWAFQQEIGYGQFSYQGNKKVVQIRPQVRYYMFPYQKGLNGIYLAFEPFFTRAMKHSVEEFYRSSFPLDIEERTTAGALLKTGVQVRLARKWLLDVYMGAGFQYMEHYQTIHNTYNYPLYLYLRDEYEMTGMLGFSFGYSLWNKKIR